MGRRSPTVPCGVCIPLEGFLSLFHNTYDVLLEGSLRLGGSGVFGCVPLVNREGGGVCAVCSSGG